MTRYGMLIEANWCTGCATCVFACKDEFEGNAYPPYTAARPVTQWGYGPSDYPNPSSKLSIWANVGHFWMNVENKVNGTFPNVKSVYIAKPCMQCDNPPCMKAATNGAVTMRSDGIVIVDPAKSIGQKGLVDSCPYGRIYWNADSNIPQACNFCAHLIDQGKKPRCVEACPLGLITFGDLDDPNSYVSYKIKNLKAKQLNPELGTNPKVYYTGLI